VLFSCGGGGGGGSSIGSSGEIECFPFADLNNSPILIKILVMINYRLL
jgi:hypothetical protein